MVILRKIADLILGFDEFGQGIVFEIKNKEKFSTYPGSFISMIIGIIILAYGYTLSHSLFTYKDSTLSNSFRQNFFSQTDIYQPFPADKPDTIGFNIAFNLLDPDGNEIP